MRFKEFLTEVDLNVSFNPAVDKPQDIINKAKKAARLGSASPQRLQRARQEEIKNRKKEIAAREDDPLEPLRLQIKTLEQKVARMKQNLISKEQNLARQRGTEPGAGEEEAV